MSTATRQYQFGIVRCYPIQASGQVVVGKTCVFGATAGSVQDSAGASDVPIGVVRPHPKAVAGVITAAALTPGDVVEVMHPFNVIEAMLVGTGGTTNGKRQMVVSDGITDAPANGGGSTGHTTVGIALQTGVTGDMVGVGLIFCAQSSAT